MELCPVCHEVKPRLQQHLVRCGLERSQPGRTESECTQLVAKGRQRVERLAVASVSVFELQRMYGPQWAIVADALRRFGGPVYIGFGLDRRLDTDERLDRYLANVASGNLRIDRGSSPLLLESTGPRVLPPAPRSPTATTDRPSLSAEGRSRSPSTPHVERGPASKSPTGTPDTSTEGVSGSVLAGAEAPTVSVPTVAIQTSSSCTSVPLGTSVDGASGSVSSSGVTVPSTSAGRRHETCVFGCQSSNCFAFSRG